MPIPCISRRTRAWASNTPSAGGCRHRRVRRAGSVALVLFLGACGGADDPAPQVQLMPVFEPDTSWPDLPSDWVVSFELHEVSPT